MNELEGRKALKKNSIETKFCLSEADEGGGASLFCQVFFCLLFCDDKKVKIKYEFKNLISEIQKRFFGNDAKNSWWI